jgi:hypothetical protein
MRVDPQLIYSLAKLALVAVSQYIQSTDTSLETMGPVAAILNASLVQGRRRLPPPEISDRGSGIRNVLEDVACTVRDH